MCLRRSYRSGATRSQSLYTRRDLGRQGFLAGLGEMSRTARLTRLRRWLARAAEPAIYRCTRAVTGGPGKGGRARQARRMGKAPILISARAPCADPVRSTANGSFTGVPVAKPNYHHARKQKEQARKSRQLRKEQRRTDRTKPETEGSQNTLEPTPGRPRARAADEALIRSTRGPASAETGIAAPRTGGRPTPARRLSGRASASIGAEIRGSCVERAGYSGTCALSAGRRFLRICLPLRRL